MAAIERRYFAGGSTGANVYPPQSFGLKYWMLPSALWYHLSRWSFQRCTHLKVDRENCRPFDKSRPKQICRCAPMAPLEVCTHDQRVDSSRRSYTDLWLLDLYRNTKGERKGGIPPEPPHSPVSRFGGMD